MTNATHNDDEPRGRANLAVEVVESRILLSATWPTAADDHGAEARAFEPGQEVAVESLESIGHTPLSASVADAPYIANILTGQQADPAATGPSTQPPKHAQTAEFAGESGPTSHDNPPDSNSAKESPGGVSVHTTRFMLELPPGNIVQEPGPLPFAPPPTREGEPGLFDPFAEPSRRHDPEMDQPEFAPKRLQPDLVVAEAGTTVVITPRLQTAPDAEVAQATWTQVRGTPASIDAIDGNGLRVQLPADFVAEDLVFAVQLELDGRKVLQEITVQVEPVSSLGRSLSIDLHPNANLATEPPPASPDESNTVVGKAWAVLLAALGLHTKPGRETR